MCILQASTELMKSHKPAQVLSATSTFQALQTSVGQALFFSISDTNILYLSAEQDNVQTGWIPIDLTSELAANFPGQTVTAKAFAVSQNPATGAILIAQAIQVGDADTGTDALFMLDGLVNDPDAAWLQSPAGRDWTAYAYDDQEHPQSALDIAYVDIPLSQDMEQTPYVVVGLKGGKAGYIQNYIVNVGPNYTGSVWKIFGTAENYETLQDIRLGKPKGAVYAGLYELYSLDGNISLTFTPMRGLYGPPDVTKLTPPDGASSLALLPAADNNAPPGCTDLYVAGTGGIFYYAYDAQTTFAAGVPIISNSLIAEVDYLEIHQSGQQLILWGRNNAQTVFCSRCSIGQQGDAAAWSSPIPIQQGINQLASLLDVTTQSSVLYTHTSANGLVKLTQDPVSTHWRAQSILLPHLASGDVLEIYTYTTRVKLLDENNLPLGKNAIILRGTGHGTVYLSDYTLRDAYVTLSPGTDLAATSGLDGTITLVQETRNLGAICYTLTTKSGALLTVNPMAQTVARMGNITSGDDLRKVNVTDEHGITVPLVHSSISATDTDAVAEAIVQFSKTFATLPSDGSPQTAGQTRRRAFDAGQDQVWGLDFANGSIRYFTGLDTMAAMGVHLRNGALSVRMASGRLTDTGNAIEAFAGDIFLWIENRIDDVDKFFLHVIGDITHFFIEIADDIYHFVVQCANDVAHAIQFVLNKIEVAFEQLIQWLGFIFAWQDILFTHKVLKNLIKQFAINCVGEMGNYAAQVEQFWDNVEDTVSRAAGLGSTNTVGSVVSTHSAQSTHCDSPQAHYGAYQAQSNVNSGTSAYSPAFPGTTDAFSALLTELQNILPAGEQTLATAYQAFNTDIVNSFSELTVAEIIEKCAAIIANLTIDLIKEVIVAVIKLFAALAQGTLDFLDASIDIPVLSWLYNYISGDDLSILDLGCLILAIPVTVIGKLDNGQTPFPDSDFNKQLIKATSFADIQDIYQPAAPRQFALASPQPSDLQKLQYAAGICALFGSLGILFTNGSKLASSEADLPPSPPVYILAFLSYLPYVMPNLPANLDPSSNQNWDTICNDVICALTVVKAAVDISLCNPSEEGFAETWDVVSPDVDMILNLFWEVPVIAGIARDPSSAPSIVGFIGNTAFNASGWMAPMAFGIDDPRIKPAFLDAINVCIGVYGLLSLAQGLLLYDND